MTHLTVPEKSEGDFALKLSDDCLEPHKRRGEVIIIKRGEIIRDGDVGLFFAGSEILVRQYCQDYVGNVYLFVVNRKRAAEDITIPVSADVPVCCFGKVLLKKTIPLP